MKYSFVAPLLLVLSSLMMGQANLDKTRPPDSVSKQTFPSLTAEQKTSLYAVSHDLDKVNKQMSDLTAQFQVYQTQAKTQYDALQQRQYKLTADLQATQKKVLTEMKLDTEKTEVNLDTMTPQLKSEPTPPPPAAENVKPPTPKTKK
jgi:hypothetical protein